MYSFSHWIEIEIKLSWISIELNSNFHWIEIEFSLNWNWIEIELNLNWTQIEIEFWYWILLQWACSTYPKYPENLRHHSSNYWKCNSNIVNPVVKIRPNSASYPYYPITENYPSLVLSQKNNLETICLESFVPFLTFLSQRTQLGSPL